MGGTGCVRGVELGDDRLEDLVDDGGEDTLIVVGSELLVDRGELGLVRLAEDTAGDVDHLEIYHEAWSAPRLQEDFERDAHPWFR